MRKDILPTIGIHTLSAVEPYQRKDGYDIYDGYYVVIDNVIYAFEKDPCDGYRSYGDIKIVDGSLELIKNHFPPQEVFIIYKEQYKYDYEDKKFYTIFDAYTGKVVLEIGTDYTDSYYPIAIFSYYPENMAINAFKTDNKNEEPKSETLEWVSTNTNIDIDYTITPHNVEYHFLVN